MGIDVIFIVKDDKPDIFRKLQGYAYWISSGNVWAPVHFYGNIDGIVQLIIV